MLLERNFFLFVLYCNLMTFILLKYYSFSINNLKKAKPLDFYRRLCYCMLCKYVHVGNIYSYKLIK